MNCISSITVNPSAARPALISAAPALGITNYIVADQKVKYDVPLKQVVGDNYSAAKYAYNVANDYEAFLYLYPQYKQTLSPDACYDYYLSSYHNGDKPNKYLDALDGFVYRYTNMCTFGYRYEPYGENSHKNYCACGNFVIEPCHCESKKKGDHFYVCHYCHGKRATREYEYKYSEDHPNN